MCDGVADLAVLKIADNNVGEENTAVYRDGSAHFLDMFRLQFVF